LVSNGATKREREKRNIKSATYVKIGDIFPSPASVVAGIK